MKFISYNEDAGTATVEINGKVADVRAISFSGRVICYGLAVRYPTGGKVWSGSAIYWPANGNINNISGPLDHRARRAQLRVVGFYSDYTSAVQSQHNGN